MNLLMAILLIADPNCGATTDLASINLVADTLELQEPRFDYFNNLKCIGERIDDLHERFMELKDVKYISAVNEYPPPELINTWLDLNSNLRNSLTAKIKYEPTKLEIYGEMIKEIDYIADAWLDIKVFVSPEFDIASRRRSLSYAPKIMPPPYPIWRFNKID